MIKYLEEKEDLRARAVADLAIGKNITFKEADKILDKMIEESKKRINLQAEFEAAIDAEFNI